MNIEQQALEHELDSANDEVVRLEKELARIKTAIRETYLVTGGSHTAKEYEAWKKLFEVAEMEEALPS